MVIVNIKHTPHADYHYYDSTCNRKCLQRKLKKTSHICATNEEQMSNNTCSSANRRSSIW